mmetsp:Transcript_42127/g.119162  ORF Transcript_42127/g.119162 Transcript_42127/m.119162 type:complete len:398 (+) Transcript_42127:37-1230(+)
MAPPKRHRPRHPHGESEDPAEHLPPEEAAPPTVLWVEGLAHLRRGALHQHRAGRPREFLGHRPPHQSAHVLGPQCEHLALQVAELDKVCVGGDGPLAAEQVSLQLRLGLLQSKFGWLLALLRLDRLDRVPRHRGDEVEDASHYYDAPGHEEEDQRPAEAEDRAHHDRGDHPPHVAEAPVQTEGLAEGRRRCQARDEHRDGRAQQLEADRPEHRAGEEELLGRRHRVQHQAEAPCDTSEHDGAREAHRFLQRLVEDEGHDQQGYTDARVVVGEEPRPLVAVAATELVGDVDVRADLEHHRERGDEHARGEEDPDHRRQSMAQAAAESAEAPGAARRLLRDDARLLAAGRTGGAGGLRPLGPRGDRRRDLRPAPRLLHEGYDEEEIDEGQDGAHVACDS